MQDKVSSFMSSFKSIESSTHHMLIFILTDLPCGDSWSAPQMTPYTPYSALLFTRVNRVKSSALYKEEGTIWGVT